MANWRYKISFLMLKYFNTEEKLIYKVKGLEVLYA